MRILKTMNLDTQLQLLIDGAPDAESRMSVIAIGSILKQIAETFGHEDYFICQSAAGDWSITTMRHKDRSDEIQVLYAYSKPELVPIEGDDIAFRMPIIRLLFEVLAIPAIDRVFFVHNSDESKGLRTIGREDLERSISEHLQKIQKTDLPPDLC
jgi:hypothetical protein